MNLLLSPPVAFLAYIPLVLVLIGVGRLLAGPANANGGEVERLRQRRGVADLRGGARLPAVLPHRVVLRGRAPGHARTRYRDPPGPAAVYLGGLFIALVALILG